MPHDTPSKAYRTLLYHAYASFSSLFIPHDSIETLMALGSHAYGALTIVIVQMN